MSIYSFKMLNYQYLLTFLSQLRSIKLSKFDILYSTIQYAFYTSICALRSLLKSQVSLIF